MRTHYKGHAVDVDVRLDAQRPGSHIVVVVHDPDGERCDRRVEYLTDDVRADAALHAGLGVAQALVDGRIH
jgi:hypothetical protein